MRFTTPRIQVFSSDGSLRREIRVGLPIEVVSEAEREEALDALRRSLTARGLPPEFIQQNLVVMEDRWLVKCRFGPLRLDPSARLGAFLEQNPDEFGSGPATLHLLSQDGVYLTRVTFPEAWEDFAMAGGVVYALTRDSETDLITLAASALGLPDSLSGDASAVLEEAREEALGAG